MRYVYPPGAKRGRRPDDEGDVRAYRPRRGWTADAELLDVHPVTGRPLPGSQWWIREVFTGPRPTRPHHR